MVRGKGQRAKRRNGEKAKRGTFCPERRVEERMWQPVVFLTVAVVLTLARPADAAVDHSPWDTLLKRYVDADGRVAYRDLQAHDRPAFERYLATLAQAQVEGMTEAEEKALWINAYNAAIVKGGPHGYTVEDLPMVR